MSVGHVQATALGSVTGTTLQLDFGSEVGAARLLIVVLSLTTNASTVEVSSIVTTNIGGTDTWQRAATGTSGTSLQSDIWYSVNRTGQAGTNSVTVNLDGSSAFRALAIEVSGAMTTAPDVVDVTDSNTINTSTTFTFGDVGITQTVPGYIVGTAANGGSFSFDSEDADMTTLNNGSRNYSRYRVTTTTVSENGDGVTAATENWACVIASFKEAAAAQSILLLVGDRLGGDANRMIGMG